MVIACDDHQIAREIRKYIQTTEKVSDTIYSDYKYELISDGAVFITNESRRSDVEILQNVLESNPCLGNNFQKVYAQIAIIAHIIWATKSVSVPESVALAIDLYRDVDPDNYAIYEAHSGTIKEMKSMENIIVRMTIVFTIFAIWVMIR